MNLLAALLLFSASARVDSVYLTAADHKLAVRVVVTGTPGLVAVHREGSAARVSIADAALGGQFSGGRRFSWTPSDGFDASLVAASPARIDKLEIAATDAEVSVLLHVPPEVSVDVRRDARGMLLVFRSATRASPVAADATPAAAAPTTAAVAAAPAPPEPLATTATPPPAPSAPAPVAPAPQPVEPSAPAASGAATTSAAAPAPPVATAAPEPTASPSATPAPRPADTSELSKRLFPAGAPEAQAGGSVTELYSQLFPAGAPQPAAPEATADPIPEPLGDDAGALLGPFRVRLGVDARYVDADTFVESTVEPTTTRDNYAELQPRLVAVAPVGAGAFTLEYSPVFRALGDYDEVNSNSHLASAGLELPVGSRVTLRARDRFQSGVLDTRVVDPGGEYFFGLGRFNRNDVDAGASIVVGPRLSVELAGALGKVHFVEESNFFDYETRLATAGLGFELTPNLRAVLSYVFDSVPFTDERPEVESTAHSARLSLDGEILPLLTGNLSVAYRSQDAPNAGPGGQSFSGVTLQASLARELGRDARLSVYATRQTPLSAFEENAFYVSTGVQGMLEVPLVAQFELRGGAGYQWNDYQTVASQIGAPREDRIFGWFVGLRRKVAQQLALTGAYRKEVRSSNIPEFETDAEGLYLQLEWDIFGTTRR